MAAILCRLLFVEPCKAMGKCCSSCCSCIGDSCECLANLCGRCCSGFEDCCDFVSSLCDKPFSGCLCSAVTINAIAAVFGVIAITSNADDCDQPLLVLAIVLLLCAVVNAVFSYYTFYTVNHDTDNPLFGDPTDSSMSPSQRMWQFVKYDVWMAVYICFIVALIVLLFVAISMASSCSSALGRGVVSLCIVLFVYLGIGLLIVMGYVAADAFQEWAGECCCWLLPCLWPCLLIGCCFKATGTMERDWKHRQIKNNNSDSAYPANQMDLERGAAPYAPTNGPPPPQQQQQQQYQPGPVVQQPVAQQPVVIVQPAPQQTVYAQPQPIQPPPQQIQPPPQQFQQQPYYPQQQYQQQPYNPQAAAAPMQPGILVVNQPPSNQSAPMMNDAAAVGSNEPGTDGDDQKDFKAVAAEKGKAAAVATGKQAKKAGKAAVGWMAKKMNEMNEKVNDDKVAKGAEQQQEGVGTR